MDFKAEKKKIQNLSKTELLKYEAENNRLLKEARKRVEEAEEERKNSHKIENCFSGNAERSLIKTIKAYSEEGKLKELSSEIQKRKLNFLTPQERKAREQRRKALIRRIEVLKAS